MNIYAELSSINLLTSLRSWAHLFGGASWRLARRTLCPYVGYQNDLLSYEAIIHLPLHFNVYAVNIQPHSCTVILRVSKYIYIYIYSTLYLLIIMPLLYASTK